MKDLKPKYLYRLTIVRVKRRLVLARDHFASKKALLAYLRSWDLQGGHDIRAYVVRYKRTAEPAKGPAR